MSLQVGVTACLLSVLTQATYCAAPQSSTGNHAKCAFDSATRHDQPRHCCVTGHVTASALQVARLLWYADPVSPVLLWSLCSPIFWVALRRDLATGLAQCLSRLGMLDSAEGRALLIAASSSIVDSLPRSGKGWHRTSSILGNTVPATTRHVCMHD